VLILEASAHIALTKKSCGPPDLKGDRTGRAICPESKELGGVISRLEMLVLRVRRKGVWAPPLPPAGLMILGTLPITTWEMKL
jgi:hypothetical protein